MPRIEFYGRYATIANLGQGKYLAVRCGNRFCGHSGNVMPGIWPHRVPISTKLCDLPNLLPCTKCGKRSPATKVTVLQR